MRLPHESATRHRSAAPLFIGTLSRRMKGNSNLRSIEVMLDAVRSMALRGAAKTADQRRSE